jgi:hypothetical protein
MFENLQNIIHESVISEEVFRKFYKSVCSDHDGFDLLIIF